MTYWWYDNWYNGWRTINESTYLTWVHAIECTPLDCEGLKIAAVE